MSTRTIVIQIILTLIGLAAVERVIARWRARFVSLALTGICVLSAGIFFVFVWRPNLTNRLAEFVGVGRGVDALLYIAITACLYLFLRVLIRLENQEHLITKLVSEIALLRHEQFSEHNKQFSEHKPK